MRQKFSFDRDDDRLRHAFLPPDTALVERNKSLLADAQANAQVPKIERLHLQFNKAGNISGGEIKSAFAAIGIKADNIALRVFNPMRIPYLISTGTDRDGKMHYDHGSADCALALKEHGLYPCDFILACATFVTNLATVLDAQVFTNNPYSGAIALYHQSALYPMESSFGNLSNGFHYFLCPPSRALAGYVDDAEITRQAYVAKFQEDRANTSPRRGVIRR